MGTTFSEIFCPCLKNKNSYTRPIVNNDELIQPLMPTMINEYRSLNTVDPNLYSNIDDMRIKTSTYVFLNNKHPSDVYTQIGDIGEGSYGSVIKVKHKLTSEVRAMKIIQKKRLAQGINEQMIIEEIKILMSLDHPNIIKIYEFFVDKLNFYIVMEYVEQGDLYSFFNKIKFLNEKVICSIVRQLMSAVSYLHSKNIIHGDIKLENILIETFKKDSLYYTKNGSPSKGNLNKSLQANNVTNSFENTNSSHEANDLSDYNNISSIEIKIIDFGCSKFFLPNELKSEIVGTAFYVAPEVLNQEYNNKCDIWSVGVILYTLVNGKPPFRGGSQEDILKKVKIGAYDTTGARFEAVSKELKDILVQLLNYEYRSRPSAYQALRHIWFNNDHWRMNMVNELDQDIFKKSLQSLKSFYVKTKFQQAILTIIAHNLVESVEGKKLKAVFQQFDFDSDGRISIEDLKMSIGIYCKSLLNDEEANIIMKHVDHNMNGFIEYEEFLKATIDKSILLSDTNLNLAFNLFFIGKMSFDESFGDNNLDKSITIKEIESTIFGNLKIKENILANLMHELNKEITDSISYEEFKGIMKL